MLGQINIMQLALASHMLIALTDSATCANAGPELISKNNKNYKRIRVQRGKIVFIDVEDNLAALKEKYSFSTDSIQVIGRG
ncbi:unnamed protein product, partial [Allacma fusca]